MIGNSLLSEGPNCFLTAEYRMAIVKEFVNRAMHMFRTAARPSIRALSENPK